jgi:hypothetical protein
LASSVRLKAAAQRVIETSGHSHACNFQACDCGKVEAFKIALAELVRAVKDEH